MNDYQVMPPLSDDEYLELKTDIQNRGVMVPIEFDENGNVLDGHHRLRICKELGITDYPKIVRSGMSEEQKRTHARKLNMARRHLNREQKQELIREQLRETPEKSDRQIGRELGVAGNTVSAQRRELERTAQIEQLDTTIGADGKERPRQITRQPKIEISEQEFMDACVSEVLNSGYVNLDDISAGLITNHLSDGQYAKPNGDCTFDIYDNNDAYCTTISEQKKEDDDVFRLEPIRRSGTVKDVRDVRDEPEVYHHTWSASKSESVKKPHVVNNSTDNEWYTPSKYIESAREVMGSIDLDPASNDFANKTVKADKYYTEEDDGTVQKWFGNVWLNPPYQTTLIEKFAAKIEQKEFGQAIVLVNNASETQWYQKLWRNASAMVGPAGRIKFEKRDGAHGTPLQGQTFFYYGDNPKRFLQVFSQYGMGTVVDATL